MHITIDITTLLVMWQWFSSVSNEPGASGESPADTNPARSSLKESNASTELR